MMIRTFLLTFIGLGVVIMGQHAKTDLENMLLTGGGSFLIATLTLRGKTDESI